MPIAARFVTATVGTQWDVKERIFNRYVLSVDAWLD